MSPQKINLVDSAMTHGSQGVSRFNKIGSQKQCVSPAWRRFIPPLREVPHIFERTARFPVRVFPMTHDRRIIHRFMRCLVFMRTRAMLLLGKTWKLRTYVAIAVALRTNISILRIASSCYTERISTLKYKRASQNVFSVFFLVSDISVEKNKWKKKKERKRALCENEREATGEFSFGGMFLNFSETFRRY